MPLWCFGVIWGALGCFGVLWGDYYDCINRSRDECGTYCVLCDADANFVGHTCPEPEPPQPNGQCYELAKHSLNTWSIANLADGWIIDGPGYGYSVYEWGLGAENKPHDTLYKLNSLDCNTSDSGTNEESEDDDFLAEEPCGYRGMNCLLKTGTGPYPEGVSIGYDMMTFQGLYYGGLVEDKDCHNLLDNGYQCELYYKIDENGDRIAPQQFPEIVDKSFFVGTYEKQPITNNWHEVNIYINEEDQLIWQNGATEWTYPGKPNKENIDVRLTITDSVLTSLQGTANGNREYSSVTVNIYLFVDTEGNGPLKSILNLSKG